MSVKWSTATRLRFDTLVEGVISALPAQLHALLEESPLIVEDAPTDEFMHSLGMDPHEEDLCGLHTGLSITERGVPESGQLPDRIQIFRRAILDAAGGWDPWVDDGGESRGGDAAVMREIRITILHEIGHHFGLNETDLERLGYG